MNKFEKIDTLSGKVVVVTGGYGQVGKVACQRFASLGATVISIVRSNIEDSQQFMKTLKNSDTLNHRSFKASVDNTEEIKNIVRNISANEGRCDILINAAGVTGMATPADLRKIPDDAVDSILVNNLKGVLVVTREFIDLLSVSKDSLVINVTSVAGLRGSRSHPLYAASKAGIDVLTKTFAKSFAPDIRFVSIAPGYLDQTTSGGMKRPGVNAEIAKITPLGRVGYADDIVNTMESLALSMRFLTGQVITVDGGLTL